MNSGYWNMNWGTCRFYRAIIAELIGFILVPMFSGQSTACKAGTPSNRNHATVTFICRSRKELYCPPNQNFSLEFSFGNVACHELRGLYLIIRPFFAWFCYTKLQTIVSQAQTFVALLWQSTQWNLVQYVYPHQSCESFFFSVWDIHGKSKTIKSSILSNRFCFNVIVARSASCASFIPQ